MPPAATLPASLQPLSSINALMVRDDPDFARDMERVVEALEHAPAAPPRSARTARAEVGTTTTITTAAATRQPLERPSGLPPRPERARNPLVVVLAVVLVVTSLDALSAGGIAWSRARTAAQQTAAASTTAAQQDQQTAVSARATLAPQQTATAATLAARTVRFPYVTATPGPVCDHKNAEWQQLQTLDPPNQGIQCETDRVRVVALHHYCDAAVCYDNGFLWMNSQVYTHFPGPPVRVSLQLSNLTGSDTTAIFMLSNGDASRVSYSAQLAGYGVWSAVRTDATTPSGAVLDQGSFTPAGTTIVTFTLLPTGVTYSINGDNHPVRSESTPFQLNELMFEIHGSSGVSVELSNFSITPLT